MSFLRRPSDPHSVPSIFPTYLLPSVPFRRKSRQSSTDSSDSTTSHLSATSTTSSNPFTRSPTPVPLSSASSIIIPPDPSDNFLSGHSSRLHCAKCSTDLCLTSQIISKGFTGRHGRAYLVQGTPSHIDVREAKLPNTYQNKAVPRSLVTGQHTVSDISCAICGMGLGWKYVEAAEEAQKYKVGKYILETKRVRRGVSWENDDGGFGDGCFEEGRPLPPDMIRGLSDGPSRGGGGGGGSEGRGGAVGLPEVEFDSQDEDECEDLFAGVWNPQLALKKKQRRRERGNRVRKVQSLGSRSDDTLS